MTAPTSLAETLLAALDMVVLQRVSQRRFTPVATAPRWFERFAGHAGAADRGIVVGEGSEFLANFMIDAEAFWADAQSGRIGSGLWSEVDDTATEQHFEASACFAGDRKLLIINRLQDGEYPQRQAVFQGARDAMLRASQAAWALARSKRAGVDEHDRSQLTSPAPLSDDVLTALPNRAVFEEHLSHRLASVRRARQGLCVVLVSVDGLARLDATQRPDDVEFMLRALAARLWACAGASDTVARFGRGEFAVLVTVREVPHDALQFVSAVQEILRPVYDIGTQQLFISASLGVAMSGDEGADAAVLMARAAAARDQAKGQGGNACRFSVAGVDASAQHQLQLDRDLRLALERNEFVLHYQARLDLATRRILGMEALLRWRCPQRGLVPPLEFIPFAERTGLIVPIGEWVLRTACKQVRAWQKAGLSDLALSVNLSVRQLERPELVETVRAILDESGLAPSCLELELTESAVMQDVDACIPTLHALKSLGIGLAIDDFGTGHSSLAYLKRLPMNVLKIDRAFVNDVSRDSADAAIVAAIVTVAHQLDLTTVAEGVTTESQFGVLGQLGCDEVQGFLFSRAVPRTDFAALVHGDRDIESTRR